MMPYQQWQPRSWVGKTAGQYHDLKVLMAVSPVSRFVAYCSCLLPLRFLVPVQRAHDRLISSLLLHVPKSHECKSQDSMLQPEPCSADRGWKVVRRARISQPNRTIRLMHSSLFCLTWMGGRKVEGCHPRRPALF